MNAIEYYRHHQNVRACLDGLGREKMGVSRKE
jgi:hypothetical protein